MNNNIIATIPFDFKGEHYTPSAKIDLDDFVENDKELSNIFSSIAAQNQIGLYSYEYEVLLSSEIIFSQPEGSAKQFYTDAKFDLDRFRDEYHENKMLHAIEEIAREYLQVDELEQNPALKRALLKAYRYGRETLK